MLHDSVFGDIMELTKEQEEAAKTALNMSNHSTYEIAHGEPITDGMIYSFISPYHSLVTPLEQFTPEDHKRFSRLSEYYGAGLIPDDLIGAYKKALCLHYQWSFVLNASSEQGRDMIQAYQEDFPTLDELDEMFAVLENKLQAQ